MKIIVVAGGCFWGVEHYYGQVRGILKTQVGYANSILENINYKQACSGDYDAVEAVLLTYDENEISLEKIVELLFRIIDPTSLNRQAGDVGIQYRTGVYTNDKQEQDLLNELIKTYQQNYQKPIVVEIKPLDNFYDAEEYHQKYLVKNTNGYCHVDFSKLKEEDRKWTD